MRSFRLILVVLVLSAVSFAQSGGCGEASERSDKVSVGANMIVVMSDVYEVSELFGIVTDPSSTPLPSAIIDVFKANGLTKEKSVDGFIENQKPVGSYKVDKDGRFCLKDLPNGEYALRIGTDRFAFMHTYLKVVKLKGGSDKPIEIALEFGN